MGHYQKSVDKCHEEGASYHGAHDSVRNRRRIIEEIPIVTTESEKNTLKPMQKLEKEVSVLMFFP